ncbi:hypothetical protein [Buchananella hordeovulneris]|uniref:Uncharacterized protein n=1 Tax=Buchananella hordeovulneris TaxID=52770 RepID=A0A1Q5PY21_9ACTO|nr:hypothetical protein [Buchananella hordeovulneris]OKL52349.1 hypothetical protein BSZ40_02380 [Buchananella hordeovulneris]
MDKRVLRPLVAALCVLIMTVSVTISVLHHRRDELRSSWRTSLTALLTSLTEADELSSQAQQALRRARNTRGFLPTHRPVVDDMDRALALLTTVTTDARHTYAQHLAQAEKEPAAVTYVPGGRELAALDLTVTQIGEHSITLSSKIESLDKQLVNFELKALQRDYRQAAQRLLNLTHNAEELLAAGPLTNAQAQKNLERALAPAQQAATAPVPLTATEVKAAREHLGQQHELLSAAFEVAQQYRPAAPTPTPAPSPSPTPGA